jgi:protein ImuA
MATQSKTLDLAYGEPRARLVEELRRQMGQREGSPTAAADTFSTGTPALDQLLAANPLRYGMLTEWLSGLARSGAATLSLLCAREACRQGGTLVVIDRRQIFYPPAAAAWGIDLSRLIIVRPRNTRDEFWAAVQSLRSPAVAAVWAPIDRLHTRAFRQLQLAAQAGRTLGLLLRPSHVRGQLSWADVQLCVEGKLQNANCKMQIANYQANKRNPFPTIENLQFRAPPVGWSCNLQSRFIRVSLLRTNHGRPGGSITLAIDDAAHTISELKIPKRAAGFIPAERNSKAERQYELPLHLAPELADPTTAPISARA